MCGRFGSTKPYDDLALRLGARTPADFQPRFNIAPTQPVAAVVNEAQRLVRDLRWGLIPSWTADPAKLRMLSFNARIESLANSPAYRSLLTSRRCAIFADGYYEWRKNADGTKTPLWIFQRGGDPFVFAGVWDEWRSRASAEIIRSCSIVTQPPNAFVASIHSRMPVVLAVEALAEWLAPDARDAAALLRLLDPAPGERWTAYEVSPRVGNVHNDDSELIRPIA
jgi:putative SOS response-associated peptidase YedK